MRHGRTGARGYGARGVSAVTARRGGRGGTGLRPRRRAREREAASARQREQRRQPRQREVAEQWAGTARRGPVTGVRTVAWVTDMRSRRPCQDDDCQPAADPGGATFTRSGANARRKVCSPGVRERADHPAVEAALSFCDRVVIRGAPVSGEATRSHPSASQRSKWITRSACHELGRFEHFL